MASHQKGASRILATAIFMIGVAVFAQSQTPEPVRKATGSISGRVTVDGKPAASIFVAAVAGETLNRRDAAARAITDSDGHYLIAGLAAGQYQVWTMTPNLIADVGAHPGYYTYYGASKSINLDGDEQVANVDLRLMRGSVITGRVTNPDNKPVVGEAVTIQLLDQNGNPRYPVAATSIDANRTDDRGIYRIYGLQPGRYKVSVGNDPDMGSFRGRRYEQAFYLDPTDQSKPGVVELHEGDVAENIDIRVQPPPPTYSVSGRVIDTETGTAIPKSGVIFSPVAKDGSFRPGTGIQANDRGEFNFGGFAVGRYTIRPTAEFYGGNFYGDPVEIEVIDKDLTDIEVKTTPGLSLSGVVVAEGLSSREILTMLPGLTIWAGGSTSNDRDRNRGRAAVAADGSFTIGGLRPGKISVSANSQSPPYRMPSVRLENDGAVLPQNFDLQRSLSGLRVVIDYGTGTLRGSVKFAGDVTVDSSRIHISYRREGARNDDVAQVDTRGRFVATNLAPGAYEVVIQVGGRLANDPSKSIPVQRQVVNVTNGQETEVTFNIDLAPKP